MTNCLKKSCRTASVACAALIAALGASDAQAFIVNDYLPLYRLQDFKVSEPGSGIRSITVLGDNPEDCTISWTFDEQGRLISERRDGNNIGWGSVIYYSWSGDKLASATKESHGSDVSYNHSKVKYGYDKKGRLAREVYTHTMSLPPQLLHAPAGTFTISYTYDDNDRVVLVKGERTGQMYDFDSCSVTDAVPYTYTAEFTYDNDGRVITAAFDDEEISIQETYAYPDYSDIPSAVSSIETNKVGETVTRSDSQLRAMQPYNLQGIVCLTDISGDNSEGEYEYVTLFSDYPHDRESMLDINNPSLGCNQGPESLLGFMRRFTTDSKLRIARSASMLRPEEPMSVAALLVAYNPDTATTPISLTDENAQRKLGRYEEAVDMTFKFYSDGYYFYQQWTTLDDDLAVLRVETYQDDVPDSILQEYVFTRVDGRWHLAGRIPLPTPER